MPFPTFSTALAEGKLVWRTYTAADTLLVEGSVSNKVVLTFKYSPDFYQSFIQGFSTVAAPLTSMLKTSGSIESTTRPGKGGVGVDGDGGNDGGH